MAEFKAANDIQKANNLKEVANQTLVDFSRSLGNSLRMEAAGKQYNEAINTVAMQLEGRTTLRVNASLAAADRIGQLAAGAAATGIGGSSIELLTKTVELQRNIEQDLQRVDTQRMAAVGGRSSASIISSAANSQDLSRSFGNFNYTVNVEPQPLKHRALKLLGVAAATYFGGPQAGQAAADAAVGEWKQNNGDWDAAGAYFGRAASGLAASAKDWGGGDSNSNSWFGRVMEKNDVKKSSEINWGDLDDSASDSASAAFSFGKGFGADWFSE
jgi:hypothetical protein